MFLTRFETFCQNYPYILLISSLLSIGLIGYLDYMTGNEIFVTFFYLFPVIFSTWALGNKVGIGITVLTAITQIFADTFTFIHPFPPFYILIWNFFIFLGTFLIVIYFLNVIKKLLEKERMSARTDSLTLLPNRRYFFELSEIEAHRSARLRHPISLAYLDIDNFKKVNDTLGHDAGDKLLKIIADGLKHNLRDYDIPSRLGGDEFVILLPESGEEQAKKTITKLQEKLNEIIKDNKWPVSLSIGVLTVKIPRFKITEMVKIADQLMYQVKKAGKNNAIYLTE